MLLLISVCLVLKKVDRFSLFVRDTIYSQKLILDAVYSINFVMEMQTEVGPAGEQPARDTFSG